MLKNQLKSSQNLESWKQSAGKQPSVIVPVIKRRKNPVQGVHNQLHSGMICSRSISHVSVLNLNIKKIMEQGRKYT